MENASKALIIAGAILLAILLISLGIMIFNQAQDTVTNSGMSEADVTTFNNKFLKYEGNIKGTMVKAMIQEVLATNSDSGNKDGVTVKVNGSATTNDSGKVISTENIKNNNTYNVELEYGGSGGKVSNIKVSGSGFTGFSYEN